MRKPHKLQNLQRKSGLTIYLRLAAHIPLNGGGVKFFTAKILHQKYLKLQTAGWKFAIGIPAVLADELSPKKIKRGICSAGHKAMFNRNWGGLPDVEFLETLSPGLGVLRSRLYGEAFTAEQRVGFLSPEWAKTLGLSTHVVIAVGAFDAHMGAVGAEFLPAHS